MGILIVIGSLFIIWLAHFFYSKEAAPTAKGEAEKLKDFLIEMEYYNATKFRQWSIDIQLAKGAINPIFILPYDAEIYNSMGELIVVVRKKEIRPKTL